MARVVFDLDGTLVGFLPDGRLALNRRMLSVARRLREAGHVLVLWTFGNRRWWREVARRFPVLRETFHEVYSRDELPGRRTRVPGGVELVKDIRLVDGDVLVDNDESHRRWARRHGLESRYVVVPTFGVRP